MRWERTITVIGCHVGGEENDVIVGGVLPPPGATMFEKKRYLETHGDELRRWLLFHESIIGSRFEAAIAGQITVGGRPGIVPTIAGQAWITGVFQHGWDPTDPFRAGYTLPDLWFA